MDQIDPDRIHKIYIWLRQRDLDLLSRMAAKEYRSTKDQASYLLSRVLREWREQQGNENSPDKT